MRKYRIPLSLLTAIFIIAVIGGSIYSYFILNTFAAVNECVISSSQTYGQADLNTCAGGTMDNLTINGGVILTLTEAITLSGTVTVNGTITHTAEDTDGVNITAANINISATGLINTNAKGCQGGNGGATNGYGPNTSTGICAINTSGYGGAHASGSGAGHGGRGGRGHTDAGGTTYDSSTIPALLGSGGGGGSGPAGGYGGGKIILTVSGTLTVNGTISANGQNGPTTITNGGGGGSGGSVYISTSVITGSATISANGGNGGEGSQYAGGGGGGGRVAVYYNDAAGFTLSNITSTKGLAGTGVGSRLDGNSGSTFILDQDDDNLRVVTGLDLRSDTDYTKANITFDNGSIINCDTFATLNFGATATLAMNGTTWTCSTIDTINISAATWVTSNTNTITFDKAGAQVDWDITNTLTLNNLTYTGAIAGTTSGNGGVLSMDNAVAVSLINTDINSNINWTNLTSLNIDADSSISSNVKGCQGGNGGATNGYGPNTSTGICAINTSGYGGAHASGSGAGHGGRGGRGHTDAGGTTYDSSTIPALLGSGGGGGSGPAGGYGGGKIILTVSGTLTVNGTISANGQNGPTTITNGGGGGSGGSVYISTSVITGSATISANGGNGGEGSQYAGGGGGGGRVAVYYNDAAGFTLSNITSTKGLAGTGVGSRLDGSDGTTYTFQYLVPTQPSISYPLPNSYSLPLTNFTIISSIFPTDSQYKTHTSSDWKIQTGSNCNTNTGIIWSSLDDTTNKTSITVEGTLIANTTYYACTRYTNSVGDATWSTSVQFQTIPDIATSTQNYNFSTSEEYTIGSQVSVAGGVATTNSILWYNSSWTKRVPITITEASGSTLTNYAVRLSVTYDADMQADFDDIRFIDSDGTTLMDHWLETKIDSTSSVFWVEIPTLTASTAQTIYMYYGNVDATSVSSGANTFTMFDDFESYVDDSAINGQGGWVTQRVGGSGYAKIATLNGRKYLRSKTTSSGTTVYRALTTDNTGYAIRTSVYASNYTEAFIIDLLDGTYQSAGNITNGYGALFGGWTNTQGSLRSTSSGSVSDSTFVHSFTNSTAYALDFIWNGSTLTMKQNDLTIKTRTLSTYSSLSYVDIEAWNTLDIYTDWFLVRKYVSTEPTVGVPGAEVSSFANTALRIINATGLTYNQLYNFTETLGSDTNGEVKYQISNNGTNWYYFNTSTYAWTSATEGNLSHTNTDDEVNAYLGQFVDDIGTGSLYIGSYLIANGGTIDLSNLAVTYIAGPNFSTAELTEPINTPSVGAALTFTATIPNSASVTGTNTAFVVNVPSTMTYVANSITLGALSKTDTIDDDETQYDSENTRITVNIGNINGSSSATITFQLTVNEGLDHLQNIAINGVISADNALSDITITKNILVIGTTASNIPVGLTLTLVSNDATDLSATSVAGPQNIKFKKGSDSIATMNIRFNSDDQPDFSVINSDVDTSNKKAFLHGFSNLSESVKVEPTYTLIVPGSSPNNRVVVCPGAEDFSSISKICTNHIVLEDGESTTYNGYTVAANWSGSGWEVSGLTSTGGG